MVMGSTAFADSLDPHVTIGDPTNCSGPGNCNITEDSFTFTLPGTTTFAGILSFTNNTGHTWFDLFLTENAVPSFDITCGTNAYFNFCVPSSSDPSGKPATIAFLNIIPNPGTGIPSGATFTLDFEPDGLGTWPAGTQFEGEGNAINTPEPGSKVLLLFEFALLIGVGFVIQRRKLPSPLV